MVGMLAYPDSVGGLDMREFIMYFIGFLVLVALNSWMDYTEQGTWHLQENIGKALFIMLFIRGGFWFEKRVKRKEAQEQNDAKRE
ncbi:hypothetical protein DFR62_1526 [Planococcus citreus]|uniref:Uncharacterized protein n=2 Tax=Planococcus citreus TaxID=1373 RepID=A0A497YNS3_9BACL|nr:hypothetical protein DFR62_1526 [Planococcus citreus]